MKRKQAIILGLFVFAILLGVVVYQYTFNTAHRNIANEVATATLSVDEFYLAFENDEALATTNYLDKVVETKGEITLVEDNAIVLNNRVQVSFKSEEILNLQKGTSLIIKGRCIGYDELLEMVKVDQAIVINKEN
jgi:hypothetical protein